MYFKPNIPGSFVDSDTRGANNSKNILPTSDINPNSPPRIYLDNYLSDSTRLENKEKLYKAID